MGFKAGPIAFNLVGDLHQVAHRLLQTTAKHSAPTKDRSCLPRGNSMERTDIRLVTGTNRFDRSFEA